jgi:hypothetical protein
MIPIFFFYRNFVWLASFFTLVSCHLTFLYGGLFVVYTIWMKVLTNIVLALYIHIFHPDQYIFYNNLGFDKARLYILTFIFDFIVWVTLTFLTILLLK